MRQLAALALVLAWLAMGCARQATPVTPTWERAGLAGSVRPEWGSPHEADAVPDFALRDAAGKVRSMSELRGDWVLLHFTAAWCPYCDSEVDHLGQIAQAYGNRLRVVLVDVKDDPEVWARYRDRRVASEVLALHDSDGSATARFAPPGAQPELTDRSQVPLDSTLIIDPQGKIRLFLLPDSAHFDPTFRAVQGELDRFLAGDVRVRAPSSEITSASRVDGTRVVSLDLRADSCAVVTRLDVADGYHIMSDKPSEPTYIATRVDLRVDDRVVPASGIYPTAAPYPVGTRTIATFRGEVLVRTPIDPSICEGGSHRVTGAVTYQACTATTCLFPVHRDVERTLVLAP